ncbi:MAG TPA: hypothetical protein ENK66_02305 [Arcobacter sp.]|nr:hypothetical protein [Arcobacter sp.]
MEKQLNIPELLELSDEEIAKKVELKELALQRQKAEIKEQNSHIEQLINDDLNHKAKEESFLNSNKVTLLQEQSKKVFIDFLNEKGIKFLALKDGSVKLNAKSSKEFAKQLKAEVSVKRTLTNEESSLLFKIHKQGDLKISFRSQNSDDMETLYLYLNHIIISMIVGLVHRDKKTYSVVKHHSYKGGYAIVFRLNFEQLRVKSMLRTIVVDDNLQFIKEVDYFEFISSCAVSHTKSNVNLQEIENKMLTEVIKSKEKHEALEWTSQNRLIDIKIDSMKSYFKKQINKAKRLEKQVKEKGIVRMRAGEIENWKAKEVNKITELMNQKKMVSDFEILGVVGIEK